MYYFKFYQKKKLDSTRRRHVDIYLTTDRWLHFASSNSMYLQFNIKDQPCPNLQNGHFHSHISKNILNILHNYIILNVALKIQNVFTKRQNIKSFNDVVWWPLCSPVFDKQKNYVNRNTNICWIHNIHHIT